MRSQLILVAFVFSIPSVAHAQQTTTGNVPDAQRRTFDGPSTNLTATSPDDAVKRCVTHYYGGSLTPLIAGDGIVIMGVMKAADGVYHGMVAPSVALSIGGNVRITDLTKHCGAQPVDGAPNTFHVSVDTSLVVPVSLFFSGAPVALSMVDLTDNSQVQVGFAGMAMLGVRLQFVWWDDSASSRHVVSIPLGFVVGGGAIEQMSTTGGPPTSIGTSFFGALFGVRFES